MPSLPAMLRTEATDEMELGGTPSHKKPKCRRSALTATTLAAAALIAVASAVICGKLNTSSGILAADGKQRLHLFKDPRGRCMMPETVEAGARLVLARCQEDVREQRFMVEGSTIHTLARSDLCVMLSGDETSAGRSLLLDDCRKGDHSQQIEGMCLGGEAPELGSAAFAKTCDPAVGVAVNHPRRAGTTLYCIMVEMSTSGEVLLDYLAKSKQAGIYGCDANKVYEGLDRKGKPTTENFIGVWQKVFEEGKYKSYDWTIKADPDTVWLPDRLRARLDALEAMVGEAVYVRNSFEKLGFLSPLEILSQAAVEKISHTYRGCRGAAPEGADGEEDAWMKPCLDASGVDHRSDEHLLNTNSHVEQCTDQHYVAFHAFKGVGDWGECLDSMRRHIRA